MDLHLSLTTNITRTSLSLFGRLGLLSQRKQAVVAEDMTKHLDILTYGCYALVQRSWAATQQKVAIANWLSRHSDVYILDEPTVSVDIRSKVEI
jgi:ribose transport system ATP-binding protein